MSVVDQATWLAAVVGTRLMWLAADSEQWVSISPVPVASSLAARGGAVYALSSGGILCGTPPALTLCSVVTGGGILFSRAFGLLVSDGPRLTTSTGEAYTLGDGWLPSAAATAMGGRVLLGLDARALRGVAWVSASPLGVGDDCPLARWWVDPRLDHCPLFVDTDDAGMGLSLADVSSEVATASTQTPLQTRLFSPSEAHHVACRRGCCCRPALLGRLSTTSSARSRGRTESSPACWAPRCVLPLPHPLFGASEAPLGCRMRSWAASGRALPPRSSPSTAA